MAAQRQTKILGIFVRLLARDGKPQYLRHIPRIKAYLRTILTHPARSANWPASTRHGTFWTKPTPHPAKSPT